MARRASASAASALAMVFWGMGVPRITSCVLHLRLHFLHRLRLFRPVPVGRLSMTWPSRPQQRVACLMRVSFRTISAPSAARAKSAAAPAATLSPWPNPHRYSNCADTTYKAPTMISVLRPPLCLSESGFCTMVSGVIPDLGFFPSPAHFKALATRTGRRAFCLLDRTSKSPHLQGARRTADATHTPHTIPQRTEAGVEIASAVFRAHCRQHQITVGSAHPGLAYNPTSDAVRHHVRTL